MKFSWIAGCLAACGTMTGLDLPFLEREVTAVLRAKAKTPPPSLPEERRRIVASLPEEGRVVVAGSAAEKIAALGPVLRAYDRDYRIEVRVVVLPYAAAALYARTVLLLSEHTVNALPAGELQALAAHELAHDYWWEEYETARSKGDTAQLKALELLADGMAVAILARMGLNPRTLISGVKRLQAFNQKLGLRPINASEYPSVQERARFHDMVLRNLRGQLRLCDSRLRSANESRESHAR